MGGKYTLIINVLNKDLVPVTFIDNDIPGLPSYYKDTLIDYLSPVSYTHLQSRQTLAMVLWEVALSLKVQ